MCVHLVNELEPARWRRSLADRQCSMAQNRFRPRIPHTPRNLRHMQQGKLHKLADSRRQRQRGGEKHCKEIHSAKLLMD
jgi:hypothetical protein